MFKKPFLPITLTYIVLVVAIVLFTGYAILAVATRDSDTAAQVPTAEASYVGDRVVLASGFHYLIRTIDWEMGIVCYEGPDNIRCFLISETHLAK